MSNKLRLISLACFFIPIFTVIISYIISIKLNLVEMCIPIFEGCTSISRVGRYEPVKFFFKPMMYLYSISIFFFWIIFSQEINNFKKNINNIPLFINGKPLYNQQSYYQEEQICPYDKIHRCQQKWAWLLHSRLPRLLKQRYGQLSLLHDLL